MPAKPERQAVITIEPEERAAVDSFAEQDLVSRSLWIRRAVVQALEARGWRRPKIRKVSQS